MIWCKHQVRVSFSKMNSSTQIFQFNKERKDEQWSLSFQNLSDHKIVHGYWTNIYQRGERTYISTCIKTNVCKLIIHAFHKNLIIHEIRRATKVATNKKPKLCKKLTESNVKQNHTPTHHQQQETQIRYKNSAQSSNNFQLYIFNSLSNTQVGAQKGRREKEL